MSLELKNAVELRQDINHMADTLRTSSEKGALACNWILQKAAQPIYEQMRQNASTDPRPRSGTLRDAIRIGRAVRKRGGGYRVTVGVHRGENGAKYANPVEWGHAGPHPAGPHPFVRPAFDAQMEAAYDQVKDLLRTALDSRGLL
jgi:HK97 gp10 family phage protein